MKVLVTQTFHVRMTDDDQVGIFDDDRGGLCLTKAPTLGEATESFRQMLDDESLADFVELEVIDVHPTNDKDILNKGEVKS